MSTPPPPLDVELVVVGGYTAAPDGHAVGLTALALAWSSVGVAASTVGTVPLSSPSFAVLHPNQRWLFTVSESSPGLVASLGVGADGSLDLLGTRGAPGSDGNCHLALTPDLRHLVTAGYGSGTTSSFAVDADGLLSEQLDLFTFEGSGPDPERQQTPHAHQVVPDGPELLVCDLGTDQVHRLRLDDGGRFSRSSPPIRLPDGSGPRHLVLVEDHLLVACELSAEVWIARRHEDGWQEVGRVPATAAAAGEACAPSAIVNQGRRVYVANRGPGTVAVFDLEPEQGELVPVAEFRCGGPSPRDLTLSGGRLWVANQSDDLVTVFPTAQLPPPGAEFEFAAPSPSCLVLLGGSV